MRAVSLHPDVLMVTSAVLQVNCVIVRGSFEAEQDDRAASPVKVIAPRPGGASGGETFVIDSPVLPDELDALGALIGQAAFPEPTGLLATHGDWDHLLGRLAFGALALGCAESTARRLAAEPGAAQRELRAFDEDLQIARGAPLSLGAVQALPVPGRLELGAHELELHPTAGHTADGMAVLIPWARVLVAGDYLSGIEIPALGAALHEYEQTLDVLEDLLERVDTVVPGHGAALDAARARGLLSEDRAYLQALGAGAQAALPRGRSGRREREVHAQNVRRLGS